MHVCVVDRTYRRQQRVDVIYVSRCRSQLEDGEFLIFFAGFFGYFFS